MIDGSGFSAQWLALREPVDHRSRDAGLAQRAFGWLRRRGRARPCVVDLGAGSGSNLRYLRACHQGPVHWRLVDQDADLLARCSESIVAPDTGMVQTRDLAEAPEDLLAGADLVSASALLDLVSAAWLDRLLDASAAQDCAVLMALSIDGRVGFSGPADSLDRAVWLAVARDQQRDKGLGLALAQAAPQVLVQSLRARGYTTFGARSDWVLGRRDLALARALIGGWVQAAGRACPSLWPALQGWAARRVAGLAAGRSTLRVGHQDVLGLPGPLGDG